LYIASLLQLLSPSQTIELSFVGRSKAIYTRTKFY